MIIPFSELSNEAFEGLLESYVDREGTDYGEQELTRATKVERLRQQVVAGKVVIVFDQHLGEVNLLTKEDYVVGNCRHG